MNALFDRLSLQGHLRRIVEQWGAEQGWQIIRLAVEREMACEIHRHAESEHAPTASH